MILVTATFSDAVFLDSALCALKKSIPVKNILTKTDLLHRGEELPVNYPTSPTYESRATDDYLQGKPHITSSLSPHTGSSEYAGDKQARLAFFTSAENEKEAKNIILKYSGYNIKIGH